MSAPKPLPCPVAACGRPPSVSVREAAEEAAEALAAYNSFDRDHSTVIADQCAEALRTLLAALDAAKRGAS